MRICIDPGHAGIVTDPGAVGKNARESDINLAVALKLGQLLIDRGHQAILTRTTPDNPDSDSLRFRTDLSDKFAADIFLSLHCNGFYNPAAHGFECWFFEKSYKGKLLAQTVAAQLKAKTPLASRGAKGTYNLYVLKNTAATAVLVEMGFITNPADEQYLMSDAGQAAIAQAICDALHFG